MQRLMGLVRRCADDYRMIAPNDKIAVGVSGGKDSLALLTLLAALREYYPQPSEPERDRQGVLSAGLLCPGQRRCGSGSAGDDGF